MTKKIACDICGKKQIFNRCYGCKRRSKLWGIATAQKIADLSKVDRLITTEELIEIVMKSEHKKYKDNVSLGVASIKNSLESLGYKNGWRNLSREKNTSYNHYVARVCIQAYRKIGKKDKCELCGSADNLEIHHVLPISWGGGNDLENIITLCHNCHIDVQRETDATFDRNLFLEFVLPHHGKLNKIAQELINRKVR